MLVSGRNAQSTTLPLTDTQKARQQGERERAASAHAAERNMSATPPPPTAAATMVDGIRYSSVVNGWATPCTAWAKGPCARGISCWFRHDAVATHTKDNTLVKICVVCKATDHTSAECRAPGGKVDPENQTHWDLYRERKAKALEAGKGKGKEGKQGQQPKGKGTGGKKGSGNARTAATQKEGRRE